MTRAHRPCVATVGGCFTGGSPEYYDAANMVEDALDDGAQVHEGGAAIRHRASPQGLLI